MRKKKSVTSSDHWHEPVFWDRGSLQVLCPGSVGLTSNGIARWMLIEAENDFTNFQQKTVRYLKFNRRLRILPKPGIQLEELERQ